jgi:putative endonuclease
VGRRTTGSVGRDAERYAFRYLLARDFKPVARNFRCRSGEIDLIMLDNDCLTFIEVRYRASAAFSSASDTVDARKQRKIIRTAALFVARNRRYATFTMRFDVVAIEGIEDLTLHHIADAFRPNHSTY